MTFLSRFFKKNIPSEEEILNLGLNYAMEFGSNWLQPIQTRLSKKIPGLTKPEFDRFDQVCRTAMNAGHNFIYEKLSNLYNNQQTIASTQLAMDFKVFMKEKFVWIDDSNLHRLLSQCMYYAWKDGLDKTVTS